MAILTQSAEQHFAAPGALNRPVIVPDLRITHAGYFRQKQTWLDLHFMIYAIGLVTRGHGTYRVGRGRRQEVVPGSAFTVYPGPRFHYGPDPGTDWEEHYIGIVGRGMSRWTRSGIFPADGAVHKLPDPCGAMDAMRQVLHTLLHGQRGDADRAVLMTERLLVEMKLSRTARMSAPRAGGAIESVLAYCRGHLADEIDFEALADEHAMSYSHLRQQLRRVTGVAPAHYLTRLRCQAACGLLDERNETIKRIARRVGIADPYTFSRIFRRTIGMSPKQYREQNARWRG